MSLTRTQRENAGRFSKNIYDQLEQAKDEITLNVDDAADVAELLAAVAEFEDV